MRAAYDQQMAQLAAEKATGKLDYEAGLQAFQAKNYRKAIEFFQVVVRQYANGQYVTPARQKLEEIEALARAKLAPVDKLIQEEKFQEALALLRDVKRLFAGSAAAAQAEARLQELSKSPALLAAINKAEAEDLISEAKLYTESGDLLRGVACYKQVAQQYADTDQGKEAQQCLAGFGASEDFQKQLKLCEADANCNTLLSLARSYRANKLFDAARTNYKKVLDQFPKTQFAGLATEEMKALEKEMKAAGYSTK
jgi:tetratricopeptide (TPR) repeat protein